MTFRNVLFGDDARSQIKKGVDTLANAVKVTMGPRGQNVVIESPNGPPHLTKDGVTVAQAVNLSSRFENLGAQMIKEASQRSAEIAGDGTTTATVLAQELYTLGMKLSAAGYETTDVCKGILDGARAVSDEIDGMAIPVNSESDIISVGTISANGDVSIGEMIAAALSQVGLDGTVTIEEATGFETSLDVVEGTHIKRGYLSTYFINDQDRMVCELEEPYIVLVNRTISTVKDILPILERLHSESRPALIIANEIEGEALKALAVNKLKGVLSVCAVKAPEFGDARVHTFDDLSLLIGSDVITAVDSELSKSIDDIQLGICKRAIVDKGATTLVGCNSTDPEKLEARVLSLREKLESGSLLDTEADVIQRRLSRLASGVAVLKVGAATEIEMKEKKDRVDDALHATQAAIAEGIIPGGGTALIRATRCLDSLVQSGNDSYIAGVGAIKTSCEAPLRQIVSNAGQPADVIVERVKGLGENMGFNARKEVYEDLVEAGVIDPAKVVKSAIKHAASAACNLLSVGCAMTIENATIEDSNALFEVDHV